MHFDFEWVTCLINLYKLFLCAFVFVESAKNKNGFTPLCVAALRGHVDIVRYLCSSCDANPSVATKVVITSRGSDNAYHDANVNNVAPCFDSYICTQNHRPPFLVSNSTDATRTGSRRCSLLLKTDTWPLSGTCLRSALSTQTSLQR